MRKKLLFMIYQLVGGGAEKVMIDIVNHLDPSIYEITVMTITDCSKDAHLLNKNIKYRHIFSGKYKEDRLFFKLLYKVSPVFLHKLFITETYDVEVAALEGIPAKIISGCKETKTKTISVIHADASNMAWPSKRYKDFTQEYVSYNNFDRLLFVSRNTRRSFMEKFNIDESKGLTIFNPFDFQYIRKKSEEVLFDYKKGTETLFCAIGRLDKVKGFDRLIEAFYRVYQKYPNIKLMIIGEGKEHENIYRIIKELDLQKNISLLGYRSNPYKYLKIADCYICSSRTEGLSSTVIEARVLGVPIIATDCGGMDELLEDYQKGIIVPNNIVGIIYGMEQFLMNIDNFKFTEDPLEKSKLQKFTFENYLAEITTIL